MPRIRWVNHPNPALQHLNGTIEHVAREAIAPYLVSGQAVLCPAPNYVVRLSEESAMRTKASPGDTVVSMETEWGVRDTTGSPWSHVVIIKKSRGETYFFESVPKDCPKVIADKFNRLVAATASAGADRAAIDKATQEQQIRELNDRTEKYKVFSPRFF